MTLNTKKMINLLTLVNYIYDTEYEDFENFVKEGNEPKDHIFYTSLLVEIEQCGYTVFTDNEGKEHKCETIEKAIEMYMERINADNFN